MKYMSLSSAKVIVPKVSQNLSIAVVKITSYRDALIIDTFFWGGGGGAGIVNHRFLFSFSACWTSVTKVLKTKNLNIHKKVQKLVYEMNAMKFVISISNFNEAITWAID